MLLLLLFVSSVASPASVPFLLVREDGLALRRLLRAFFDGEEEDVRVMAGGCATHVMLASWSLLSTCAERERNGRGKGPQ